MRTMLEAVALAFTCGQQIFVIRRQPHLLAFPGYHAFPGGKVDRSESHPLPNHPLLKGFDEKLMRALFREVREEMAVDLASLLEQNMVQRLDFLGTAAPPSFNAMKFETHFYRLELSDPLPFQIQTEELDWGQWCTARQLLECFEQGEMLVVPPIKHLFECFSRDQFKTQPDPKCMYFHDFTGIAVTEFLKGVIQIAVPSHTIPPAEHTNAFVIGSKGTPRLLIDPSPAEEAFMQELFSIIDTLKPEVMFLTHHHPDHHERAPQIARKYRLPILLSQDTYQRILKRWGADYFAGIELRIVKEGDVVTQWLGEPVRVIEMPGHDEGQLGLAPASMRWCLVSDLFQGVGTVVIAAPEGNMSRYFNSLQKVIDLRPQVVIPSHGIPMGSAHRLSMVLQHRKMREEQVLQMFKEGKSKQDMLDEIYVDVDKRLVPLAMKNIEAHLEKLRQENRLP